MSNNYLVSKIISQQLSIEANQRLPIALTKGNLLLNFVLIELMPQRKELEDIGVEMADDLENPYSQRILSK